jgi:hypothetical protein
VPQHRFDVRQQIESVDLQQVVLLFTWSVCLSHVVAMVLRQPKFRRARTPSEARALASYAARV